VPRATAAAAAAADAAGAVLSERVDTRVFVASDAAGSGDGRLPLPPRDETFGLRGRFRELLAAPDAVDDAERYDRVGGLSGGIWRSLSYGVFPSTVRPGRRRTRLSIVRGPFSRVVMAVDIHNSMHTVLERDSSTLPLKSICVGVERSIQQLAAGRVKLKIRCCLIPANLAWKRAMIQWAIGCQYAAPPRSDSLFVPVANGISIIIISRLISFFFKDAQKHLCRSHHACVHHRSVAVFFYARVGFGVTLPAFRSSK